MVEFRYCLAQLIVITIKTTMWWAKFRSLPSRSMSQGNVEANSFPGHNFCYLWWNLDIVRYNFSVHFCIHFSPSNGDILGASISWTDILVLFYYDNLWHLKVLGCWTTDSYSSSRIYILTQRYGWFPDLVSV